MPTKLLPNDARMTERIPVVQALNMRRIKNSEMSNFLADCVPLSMAAVAVVASGLGVNDAWALSGALVAMAFALHEARKKNRDLGTAICTFLSTVSVGALGPGAIAYNLWPWLSTATHHVWFIAGIACGAFGMSVVLLFFAGATWISDNRERLAKRAGQQVTGLKDEDTK